eukprot:sb/3478535/
MKLLQIEMLALNITLNPVIYTVTNKKFREFLLSRVLRVRARRRSVGLSVSGTTTKQQKMTTMTSPRLSVLSNPRTSVDSIAMGLSSPARPTSALEGVQEL